MTAFEAALAVSTFWGGTGKTWLAVLAVFVFTIVPLFALYQARTFVRNI